MKRQHYLINDDTMYLLPVDDGGLTESRIGMIYGESIRCIDSPNKVIDRNCRHHLYSYQARKEFTKALTGMGSKLPIIIDYSGSLIFFCTHSDRVANNNWFNIRHIHSYWNSGGKTRIRFENNEEIEVDISFSSFNNQYLNALKLHYRFSLVLERAQNNNTATSYQYPKLDADYINKNRNIAAEPPNRIYMNYFKPEGEVDKN